MWVTNTDSPFSFSRLILLLPVSSSSPKFLFVESPEASASLWHYYYCSVSLGQRQLVLLLRLQNTHTHTHTHRLIFVNCHEKKCLFHLFYLCANILLLLYIQLHTVDSVLCNKQIDSLPTVLLMLAIVGFQHLTHTALQWSN